MFHCYVHSGLMIGDIHLPWTMASPPNQIPEIITSPSWLLNLSIRRTTPFVRVTEPRVVRSGPRGRMKKLT